MIRYRVDVRCAPPRGGDLFKAERTLMATRDNLNNHGDKAAEAGRAEVEETARSARAVADEAARVGEDAVRAGADAARRSAEAARDVVHATLDTANDAFRRITDQFTDVLGFNG